MNRLAFLACRIACELSKFYSGVSVQGRFRREVSRQRGARKRWDVAMLAKHAIAACPRNTTNPSRGFGVHEIDGLAFFRIRFRGVGGWRGGRGEGIGWRVRWRRCRRPGSRPGSPRGRFRRFSSKGTGRSHRGGRGAAAWLPGVGRGGRRGWIPMRCRLSWVSVPTSAEP